LIPQNYFYYWTGQDFQFVHYLSVLSVLKQPGHKKVAIYTEEAPRNNHYWDQICALAGVDVFPADFQDLTSRAGFEYGDFASFLSTARTNHRSDLIRYLLLAVYGGVYLDFDTLVVKEMKPLLDVDFFVARQKKDLWGNEINGAIMGSSKNGVEVKECISRVRHLRRLDKVRSLKDIEVLLNRLLLPGRYRWAEAGPGLLTQLIRARDFSGAVYPVEYFQYWHHDHWREIFSPGQLDDRIYVIHYFGSRSMEETRKINEKTIWHNDSIYGNAAKAILLSHGEGPGL